MPPRSDGLPIVRVGPLETIEINDLLRKHLRKLEATAADGRHLWGYEEDWSDARIAAAVAEKCGRMINADHVAKIRRLAYGKLIGDTANKSDGPGEARLRRLEAAVRLQQSRSDWLTRSVMLIATELAIKIGRDPLGDAKDEAASAAPAVQH